MTTSKKKKKDAAKLWHTFACKKHLKLGLFKHDERTSQN